VIVIKPSGETIHNSYVTLQLVIVIKPSGETIHCKNTKIGNLIRKNNKMVHHSSFLLVLLLCVTSSYSSKIVEVNVICQKAKNPSFCTNFLNSKPGGAKGADLVTLAQYTIDVLRVNLTNTVKLINTLISKSGKDVKASTHYKNCLKYYFADGGAIFVLGNIQRVLKEGNYNLMSVGANDILHDISDCINDPNYHDTSSLPNQGHVALQIDQIIQIIAVLLKSN